MKKYVSEALCAQCARAAVCAIPNDTGEIIFSCKSFMRLDEAVNRDTSKATVLELMGSGRVYGLCGDCENRGHCMFRQREGGVWHCEEYC
ncbi:MAG: hypothetical protein BWX80_02552 [Candidatus Hydrogenedentes bacterium ADurb.Bin101]|nr:MAG: hypothetical protein BWX80_02552 [Candidatus Hydrogenedentes bacterium ADurb.Bin101]